MQNQAGLIIARLAGGGALLVAAYLVLQPFLIPMVWAAIFAYMTWPLFARARTRSGRPRMVAALFTLVVLMLLAFPVAWFLIALASEGAHLVGLVRDWVEAGAPLPTWATETPWIGARIESLQERAFSSTGEVASYLAGFGTALSQRLVGFAGGVARDVFAFSITLLSLFVFYTEGERLMTHARRLVAAVFPGSSSELVDHVGSVVRAVVFGLIGTAIVQGILASIGLAIFGVPSPVALGALTAVLSFVPVGPVLIWGGAAIWLFMSGHTGASVGMAAWGLLLVSSVDNFLRPILISRSGTSEIPFLIIFFGVLGGLMAFGLLGLFLGPVLLSVTFALLAEFPAPESPPTSPPEP